jgi:creatinine amidohydrolase
MYKGGLPMTVRLDEMSWPEVKDTLNKPNVLVLPMGSLEEHGKHLPLNVDSFTATHLAEEAAKKVMAKSEGCILVAPTIHYTDVAVHKMFPGTVGVKALTLVHVLTDILSGFLEQGFRKIIVFSSHHENNCPMEMALADVSAENPRARLFGVTSMGLGFDVRPGLVKAGLAGQGHALEIETSMSMLLQPQNVHMERAEKGSRQLPLSTRFIGATGSDRSKGIIFYSGATGQEKTGTSGDPTMASVEEGEKISASMANDLAEIILQVLNLP